MKTLVFCLEEPSARELLRGLLPRILPDDILVRYIVFEGKQDLEKRLVPRLRGWQAPETDFIVLRDQDSGDCLQIKENLLGRCEEAGRANSLVRIACRELESWYLGDLRAVEQGLNISGLARRQNTVKFRIPDELGNPVQELDRLTENRYQKLSGSRAIAPYLDLEQNRSHSFRVFLEGIRRFAMP